MGMGLTILTCTEEHVGISTFYNYPNPFSPTDGESTKFNIGYENTDEVERVVMEVTILTLKDDVVRYISREHTFADPTASTVDITLQWDGKNDLGTVVMPGIYHAKVRVVAIEATGDVVASTVSTSECTLMVN